MASPVGFDLGLPPPSTVEPTVEGRIAVYDFIRGFAILGILLANIPSFAGPEMSELLSMSISDSASDAEVRSWTHVFVSGKFRTMLAILFGIGIWLQYRKRSHISGNWPGGYLKRAMILAAFGIVHGILIWYGDILFIYSIAAFFVALFTGFSDRVLIWLAAASGGLAILAGASMTILATMDLGLSGGNWGGGAGSFGLTVEREFAAYATGNFLDQIVHRAAVFVVMGMSYLFFLPFLGGFFLLGVLMGRHEVIAHPSRHPKLVRALLVLGLGLGIPLTAAAEFGLPIQSPALFTQAVEMFYGPLVSVGLIVLLALAAERGVMAGTQLAIAKVGRTAFSCYIMQSLLCTAIFYSWGGGLFGKLDRLEMLIVVPFVWAANLLFAHYWLKKYRMGPIEWLWRSLTEGRKLDNRRRS